MTHGAISHQVKALEQWLGVPLFRRNGQSVELTDQGRLYLATISPALASIAIASRNLSQQEVLRVNTLPTFTMRWLFPRLLRFREAHPSIIVEISSGLESVEELSSHIDVIIRRDPDTVAGLVKHRFVGEMHLPVCAPQLVERDGLSEIEDLNRHTLLHCEARPTAWQEWFSEFWPSQIVPSQSLRLEHLYFALQGAIGGLGVAMGPSSMVADDVAAGRLVIPFGNRLKHSKSYYAILRQDRQHDPVVKTFCDWLADEGTQFDKNILQVLEKGMMNAL